MHYSCNFIAAIIAFSIFIVFLLQLHYNNLITYIFITIQLHCYCRKILMLRIWTWNVKNSPKISEVWIKKWELGMYLMAWKLQSKICWLLWELLENCRILQLETGKTNLSPITFSLMADLHQGINIVPSFKAGVLTLNGT